MHPFVNQEKCNGCENCAEVCSSEVYEIKEDKSNPVLSVPGIALNAGPV